MDGVDHPPPDETNHEYSSEAFHQNSFVEVFSLASVIYDESEGEVFYKICNDREEFLRLAQHIDPLAVFPNDERLLNFDVLKSYTLSLDGVYGSCHSLLQFFESQFPALYQAFSSQKFDAGVYLYPGTDYSLLFLWPGQFVLSSDVTPLVTLVRILFELSPRTCLLLQEEDCHVTLPSSSKKSRVRSRRFMTQVTEKTSDVFEIYGETTSLQLPQSSSDEQVMLYGHDNHLFLFISSVVRDEMKTSSVNLAQPSCPSHFDQYKFDFSDLDNIQLETIANRFKKYPNSKLFPIFQEYHIACDNILTKIREEEVLLERQLVSDKEKLSDQLFECFQDLLTLTTSDFATGECPICFENLTSWRFKCCQQGVCPTCKVTLENKNNNCCCFCRTSFPKGSSIFEEGCSRASLNTLVDVLDQQQSVQDRINFFTSEPDPNDQLGLLKAQILREAHHESLRQRRQQCVDDLGWSFNETSGRSKKFNTATSRNFSKTKDAFRQSKRAIKILDQSFTPEQLQSIIQTESSLPNLSESVLIQTIRTKVASHLKQTHTVSTNSDEKENALIALRNQLDLFFRDATLPAGRVISLKRNNHSQNHVVQVMIPNDTQSVVYKTKALPLNTIRAADLCSLTRCISSSNFRFTYTNLVEDFTMVNVFSFNDTELLVLSSPLNTEIVIKKKHSAKCSTNTYPKHTFLASMCYDIGNLLLYSCEDNIHTVTVFMVNVEHGKPRELRTFSIDSRFSREEIESGKPLLLKVTIIEDGNRCVCLDLNGNLLLLDLKKELYDHSFALLPSDTVLDTVFVYEIKQPQLLILCYSNLENEWVAEGRLLNCDGRNDVRVFDSIGRVFLGKDLDDPSFHVFKNNDHFTLIVYESGSLTLFPLKISTKSSSLELIYQDQDSLQVKSNVHPYSPALKLLPKALSKFGMSNVSFECDPFIDEIMVQRFAVVVAPENEVEIHQIFSDLLSVPVKEGMVYNEPVVSVSSSYEAISNIEKIPADSFIIRAIACVPIQIARFDGGTFLPLNDGHGEANWYENAVEGEGVTAQNVAECIRFGPLDLIFSYFSKLPVSVVTCAGEQSSGKSTFLNHFLGSFFDVAGSRTTVGVWISFRVSSSRVWVAIDLEGLSSYERSIQQDAYQSLFGAALAQSFVLRTSMLFGRFIEQLLKSWVEAATTLADAKDLFKAVLHITPKDVPNASVDEVITEFSKHLQSVWSGSLSTRSASALSEEQIHSLSLFRRTEISPFPPYAKFDEYNDQLKMLFEEVHDEEPKFPTTLQFRSTTALLLGKMFVQDFSSLSESARKQKLDTIQGHIGDAVAAGVIGPKEFSSKSVELWLSSTKMLNVNNLPIPDNGILEIDLPNFSDSTLFNMAKHNIIKDDDSGTFKLVLYDIFDAGILLSVPPTFSDIPTFSCTIFKDVAKLFSKLIVVQRKKYHVIVFQEFLDAIISRRQSRVFEWYQLITGDDFANPIFQRLKRDVTSRFDQIRRFFTLCKGKCSKQANGKKSSCNLPCSLNHQHEGDCSCLGDHGCIGSCNYCPEISCSLGADHAGDCVCDTTEHKCTGTCCLNNFAGCQRTCSLDLNHADDCYCAVPFSSHLCTHKCSLPKCQYQCKIAHNIEHDQHDCQNAGCHEKCLLCHRLCHSNDHFHNQTTDIHLCGNTHSCENECSQVGNCEVLTQLRQTEKVYKTSAGDQVKYQLYSEQNVQVKKCNLVFPSGQLEHDGNCDCNSVTHYCDTRCPSCGYFCSLPIEHEGPCSCTHGNMRNSKLVSMSDRVTVGQVGTFGRGDSGIALTCTNMCRQYGRGHIHLVLSDHPSLADVPLDCKKQQSGVYEVGKQYFEVTCSAYWKFIMKFDPQFRSDEVVLFESCATICGANHERPSYCTLKLLHLPHAGPLPPQLRNGYISSDVFSCTHSSVQTFHTFMIIDRSRSMKNITAVPSQSWIVHRNVLGAAIEAISNFQQRRIAQNPNDLLSVIQFNDTASVLLDSSPISDKQAFRNAVRSIRPHYGTKFHAGMSCAVSLWRIRRNNTHIPVFILLSDGKDSNRKSLEPRSLLVSLIKDFPNAIFHCVGFGNEVDRNALTSIATLGNGQYHQTHDSISLSQAFVALAKDPVRSSFV
ncbi:hypothetical protein RCL1_001823 [Eukaryota sp. TZLM3-RCL]